MKASAKTFYAIILACLFSLFLLPGPALASDASAAPEHVVPVVTYDLSDAVVRNPAPRRSWFGSSLQFQYSYSGPVRHYDGNNIGIEMTCRTLGSSSGCDSGFSVGLHRKRGLHDDYVGSAGFRRKGFSKATWENVGSGDYYFRFVKCSDSQTIIADNAAMYSW